MKARLPEGYGKGGSMASMLKQAQAMQEQMTNLQSELEEREYDISAGGGVCKIKINGAKEILSIELAPEIIDPDDPETLQDVLVAAVNEAIKRVEETSAAEMQKITAASGLNLPGMF